MKKKKKLPEGLDSIFKMTEERISKPKDRLVEIMQSSEQKEKKE